MVVVSVTRVAKLFGILAIVFAVGFYGDLRGAVMSPLMVRTNPKSNHLALTPSGDPSASAYVDAGPDT